MWNSHALMIKCRYCQFTTEKKVHLWNHYKVTHGRLKQGIPCFHDSVCPHKFASLAALKTHTSRVHEPKLLCKQIACSVCKLMFQSLNPYWSHLRKHVSQHEYVACPYNACDFGSEISSTFRSHLSRVHAAATWTDIKGVYLCEDDQAVVETSVDSNLNSRIVKSAFSSTFVDIQQSESDDDHYEYHVVGFYFSLCKNEFRCHWHIIILCWLHYI